MPRLSAFYGIVTWMYRPDHPPPHFHAQYGEHVAQIELATLRVLSGSPLHARCASSASGRAITPKSSQITGSVPRRLSHWSRSARAVGLRTHGPARQFADTHSTCVAHQTSIKGSSSAVARIASPTTGTIAELSQNLNAPPRRSSRSASTALAPRRGLGGLRESSSVAGGFCAARTAPARSRRAILPSASGLVTTADSSRATGIPRSTINTESPPLT